jgi:nucleotide-binding universal stress UspA family protein
MFWLEDSFLPAAKHRPCAANFTALALPARIREMNHPAHFSNQYRPRLTRDFKPYPIVVLSGAKQSKGCAMFDPILVPLDGSLLAECVLSHTVAIARAYNAKAIILTVLDKNQQHISAQLFDLLNWEIHKAEAAQNLGKIEGRLQKLGLHCETIVQEGSVAETIINLAQNQGANLIILSSHGHSGVSQWGISSVAQKIILSAPTSLLLVRAHLPASSDVVEHAYRQILVPLDGSRRAEIVLPMIAHLARFHKSQIHLVNVVTTPEMARQLPPIQEDVDLSNRIVERNREESIRYLEQVRLSSPLNSIPVQTHLLISDNAPAALHGLVEQENMDLVALSAHGYSGNNQWPYGSMVNNFILYSKVPLLIVQDLPIKEEPVNVDRSTRERAEH